MATAKSARPSLVIEDIWNSVALEERVELIARSQASGIMAATVSLFLVGTISYGLDEIYLLIVAFASSFFVFPLFSSQTWRTGKPSLILAYLAVRTVSRRYAHAFDIPNIDIILIYKGMMEEMFQSKEEEEIFKQKQTVDFETNLEGARSVWVVLMRGGVVVLSEKRGGAKLEYVTPITKDVSIVPYEDDDYGRASCLIDGVGIHKGRKIRLSSKYPGAQYVFLKQSEHLIKDAIRVQENIDKLKPTI